jgi:hypothetical protein
VLGRYEATQDPRYRELLLKSADVYSQKGRGWIPLWGPASAAAVIENMLFAYRETGEESYLEDARHYGDEAIVRFFDGSPLPRAAEGADYYEAITGGPTLALVLLDLHSEVNGLGWEVPSPTLNR